MRSIELSCVKGVEEAATEEEEKENEEERRVADLKTKTHTVMWGKS